jgi:excisionase family DNA binding protein
VGEGGESSCSRGSVDHGSHIARTSVDAGAADKEAPGGGGAPTAAHDEFLTVGDVAERLRVHPQTVRSWIARGELRAIKIGRTVRIRRSDFEEALERAMVAPPARRLASQTP